MALDERPGGHDPVAHVVRAADHDPVVALELATFSTSRMSVRSRARRWSRRSCRRSRVWLRAGWPKQQHMHQTSPPGVTRHDGAASAPPHRGGTERVVWISTQAAGAAVAVVRLRCKAGNHARGGPMATVRSATSSTTSTPRSSSTAGTSASTRTCTRRRRSRCSRAATCGSCSARPAAAGGGGQAMPDGTTRTRGWNRFSSRSPTWRRRRGAARGRRPLPQRHRHRRRRQADPGRRPVGQPGRAVRADAPGGEARGKTGEARSELRRDAPLTYTGRRDPGRGAAW